MVRLIYDHKRINHTAVGEALRRESGKYKMLHELGRGHDGKVSKLLDEDGTALAVKLYHKRDAKADKFFDDLCRVTEDLDDHSLMRVYGHGKITLPGILNFLRREQQYLLMEFLNGMNLAQTGILDYKRVLEVGRGVGSGLRHLHVKKGKTHGDVKPENIMITIENGPVIIDFDRLSKIGTKTEPGTTAYMSPEILFGDVWQPRSDIYSFGLTLYRSICGRLPHYNEKLDGALVNEFLRGSMRRKLLEDKGVPTDVQDILLRMIHPNSEKRFQNMDEVLEVL